MAEPLIAVRGLSKSFGGLRATDRVDLDVEDGETHAIIGPNGAGKTTLIGQLAGDLRPDAGTTRFAGRDVTSLDAPARSRLGLARSFQISNLFFGLTVLENVRLACQARAPRKRFLARLDRDRALADRARAILAEFGIADLADEPAADLSHGDQRRLEIAVCMASQPRVLLLDEPTQGLSVEETEGAVETLARFLKASRMTVLLVEHDMEVVFRLAHRITVLHRGAVIADGAPDQVKADPRVQDAYLGGLD